MLTFIVMMIAKIITLMLPKKYFFDNNRILGMANGDDSVKAWGGSYEVAANFFKTVNVFNFVKMTDWSWFLGLLMTGIILLYSTCFRLSPSNSVRPKTVGISTFCAYVVHSLSSVIYVVFRGHRIKIG